jgi:hypothetical protein
VNTPTGRKKRQICQVTTPGFSKEYKLTLDVSDVGVGTVLQSSAFLSLRLWKTIDKFEQGCC